MLHARCMQHYMMAAAPIYHWPGQLVHMWSWQPGVEVVSGRNVVFSLCAVHVALHFM
jgi:hypothetical protein